MNVPLRQACTIITQQIFFARLASLTPIQCTKLCKKELLVRCRIVNCSILARMFRGKSHLLKAMVHNLTTDPDAFVACRIATLQTAPLVEAPFGVFNFEFCISDRTLALDSRVLIPTDDKLLTIRLWEESTVAGYGASGTLVLCCVSRVYHRPSHIRKRLRAVFAAVSESIEAILHYGGKASPIVAVWSFLTTLFTTIAHTERELACTFLLKTITVTCRAGPDIVDEVLWELEWAIISISDHHINEWSFVEAAHQPWQFSQLIILGNFVGRVPDIITADVNHPAADSNTYERTWQAAEGDAIHHILFTICHL